MRRPPVFSSRSLRRALTLAAAGLALLFSFDRAWQPPERASAAVEQGDGYAAVVDGYRGWFGNYHLGALGTVWCIDHGIHAPDADLAYVPVELTAQASDTRRAMASAVSSVGPTATRVESAALMLVLHDLMGARYPSGPMSVDRLVATDLAGFDGDEQAVIDAARAIKTDAVNHARFVGPISFDVLTSGVVAGQVGHLTLVARDAIGAPVSGVVVHATVTGAAVIGAVDATTDDEGRATWEFEIGADENRFELTGDVGPVDVEAFTPTSGAAQRVARPRTERASAVAVVQAVMPRSLVIAKHGDAAPRLGIEGATFRVETVGAGGDADPFGTREVRAGADGRTPPIAVVPGHYVVTEIAPPAGYDAAGPWSVEVTDADVTLEVVDHATRGRLRIRKVDAVSGAELDGARFAVRFDPDGDGTFDTEIGDWSGELMPGRYEVRELEPPVGYLRDEAPVVVEVLGGQTAVATLSDRPIPPPPPPNPPVPEPVPTPTSPPATPPPTEVAAAAAAPPPPPPPPTPTPLAAPEARSVGVVELPRTGRELVTLARIGLGAAGAGLLMLSFAGPATNSSGRRRRRGPRRRR